MYTPRAKWPSPATYTLTEPSASCVTMSPRLRAAALNWALRVEKAPEYGTPPVLIGRKPNGAWVFAIAGSPSRRVAGFGMQCRRPSGCAYAPMQWMRPLFGDRDRLTSAAIRVNYTRG